MKLKYALTAASLMLALAALNVGSVSAAEQNKGVTTSSPSNSANSNQAPKPNAPAAPYTQSNSNTAAPATEAESKKK